MILGATVTVDMDDGVCANGFLLFRLTAEHLTPNTVTQAKYLSTNIL